MKQKIKTKKVKEDDLHTSIWMTAKEVTLAKMLQEKWGGLNRSAVFRAALRRAGISEGIDIDKL